MLVRLLRNRRGAAGYDGKKLKWKDLPRQLQATTRERQGSGARIWSNRPTATGGLASRPLEAKHFGNGCKQKDGKRAAPPQALVGALE